MALGNLLCGTVAFTDKPLSKLKHRGVALAHQRLLFGHELVKEIEKMFAHLALHEIACAANGDTIASAIHRQVLMP
jgi:hypothetical protein